MYKFMDQYDEWDNLSYIYISVVGGDMGNSHIFTPPNKGRSGIKSTKLDFVSGERQS